VAEELGGGGVTAAPSHAGLHGVRRRGLGISLFIGPSLRDLLGAHYIFLGQAWAEGKGALAMSRHCADSGQETDCI